MCRSAGRASSAATPAGGRWSSWPAGSSDGGFGTKGDELVVAIGRWVGLERVPFRPGLATGFHQSFERPGQLALQQDTLACNGGFECLAHRFGPRNPGVAGRQLVGSGSPDWPSEAPASRSLPSQRVVLGADPQRNAGREWPVCLSSGRNARPAPATRSQSARCALSRCTR